MKQLPLCFSILLIGLASRALAVAEVKDPLSRVYKVDSASVFSATIVKYDQDRHVIEAKLATLFRGDAPPDPIKILIKDKMGLTDDLMAAKDHAVGMNIVLFASARTVLAHIADHWYAGDSGARPGIYVINARKADQDGTFPGTTATLLTALEEFKTGKSTLVDTFPPITLPNPQKIGNLPANANAFSAAENPHDKTIEFFVSKANEELPAYIFDGKSLAPDKRSGTASREVNSTAKDQSKSLVGNFLAQTYTSPTADAKPDSLIIVTTTGLYRVSLEHLKPQAEDDLRLTGSKLTSFYEAAKNGFTAASIVSIDLNHDNRPDLILLTPEGTLTLLNRGFGCYLVNKNIAAPLLDPANPKALPLLASTGSTLWLLRPDGGLYRYDFPAK